MDVDAAVVAVRRAMRVFKGGGGCGCRYERLCCRTRESSLVVNNPVSNSAASDGLNDEMDPGSELFAGRFAEARGSWSLRGSKLLGKGFRGRAY